MGTTYKPSSDGEWGILGDHLQKRQPTIPPTPVHVHYSSHPEVGSISCPFNLAGLVTCFDQQNVAEVTLCLF